MGTTTQLLKASYRVVREDKRLVALPAAAMAVETAVLASFAVPYLITAHGHDGADSPACYALLAAWLFVSTSISTYFNTALFFAAAQALRGREPDVSKALADARRRIPTILAWSALSTTIALIVDVVDRRIPIVSLIMNISWSCLSYLMLPVMVFEDAGIREGMRRSKRLFRATWAEQVVGTLRLGVIGVLLAIPALFVVLVGLGMGSTPVVVATLIAGVLWIMLCVLVLTCLSNVFRVAVYLYATTGTTAPQFAGVDLSQVFRARKRRWSTS